MVPPPQSGLNTDRILLISAGTLAGAGLIGYGIHRATRSKKLPAAEAIPTAKTDSGVSSDPAADAAPTARTDTDSEVSSDIDLSREIEAISNAETFEDIERIFQRLKPEMKERFVEKMIGGIKSPCDLEEVNNIIFTFMHGKMTPSMQQALGRVAQDGYSLDPSNFDINKKIDKFKILSEADKPEKIKEIYANIPDSDFAKTIYERFYRLHVSDETHQAIRRELATIDIHLP